MSTLHFFFSCLSITFLLAGLVPLLSACGCNRKYSVPAAGYCFFYLLYSVFYGVCYYFTGKGVDFSVLYHVKYGLAGAGFGAYSTLIYSSLFTVLLFSGAGFYFLFKKKQISTAPGPAIFILSLFCLAVAVLVHPATVDLYRLSASEEGGSFFKYYRTPFLHPAQKEHRNFVYIYAESLERTYFDEQLFPGLAPHLKRLEAENISFSDINQFPQTGWTIAGMVASQCGVPMITPSDGNSMGGMDSFMGGATCLGDLLNSEGYHLAFMGGADLSFAGKGKFFRTHGFIEVQGRYELTPRLADPTYLSPWGLYDDSLFDLAVDKFEQLARTGKQFGLFLLTLDTHGSGEYLSRSCAEVKYGNGRNGALNGIACSDVLITDFIRRLQKIPLFGNTVIIVASDHKAMRNSAFGLLRKTGHRRNLFFIIDPEIEAPLVITDRGTTLDIWATALDVLGYRSYLGLGRNLLAGEPSVLVALKNIDTMLKGWRKEIFTLWSFPVIEQAVQLKAQTQTFTIDGRTFATPVLLCFDQERRTTLWFERLFQSPNHKNLLQHLLGLPHDAPFLLVNDCVKLPKEWTGEQRVGRCLVVGKAGSSALTVSRLDVDLQLRIDDLERLLLLPSSQRWLEERHGQITSFLREQKK